MRKPFVIHPILVAVFPMLFLYANNLREMSANQIIIPIAVSLSLALVLWALFGLLLKDRAKAGLATSILVFSLLTYGHFYSLLGKQEFFLLRHVYLLSALLLAFGLCVYFIRRARGDFGTVTRILNVATAVMIAINVFNIVSYKINIARMPFPQQATSAQAARQESGVKPATYSNVVPTSLPQPSATEPAVQRNVQSTPDIYLIILDEYAAPDTTKEYYDYDNEQFVKSLENKGFFVAHSSTMHNQETVRAVASILNMEYTPETEPNELTYRRITNNEVVRYLRSLGYKYVYLGHWYEVGRYEIEADSYFNAYKTIEHGPLSPEFSKTLWNTTILSPFYASVAGQRDGDYYRESLLRTLERLEQVSDLEGPKFVYAHIMATHSPFVFGPKGEHIAPGYFYNYDNKNIYLGQYVFITPIIEKVVEQLLEKSTLDPIIIVQSDHGPKWLDGWEKILNAYHLPGDGRKLLNDAVSPVNTFRIIFDYYFNASYGLLPDTGDKYSGPLP